MCSQQIPWPLDGFPSMNWVSRVQAQALASLTLLIQTSTWSSEVTQALSFMTHGDSRLAAKRNSSSMSTSETDVHRREARKGKAKMANYDTQTA